MILDIEAITRWVGIQINEDIVSIKNLKKKNERKREEKMNRFLLVRILNHIMSGIRSY
jgi:uncharacterized protein with NRDE domain